MKILVTIAIVLFLTPVMTILSVVAFTKDDYYTGQRWEYLVIHYPAAPTEIAGGLGAAVNEAAGTPAPATSPDNPTAALNEYGAQGWELVSSDGFPGSPSVWIFKRPLP